MDTRDQMWSTIHLHLKLELIICQPGRGIQKAYTFAGERTDQVFEIEKELKTSTQQMSKEFVLFVMGFEN